MSSREVIFLGTASQVPTRRRNHNALFVAWDDLGILFDPGEGTQRQMIRANLPASRVTHIAITHFHGDHCLGLPGLIQRLSLDGVEQPVEVIYPRSGQVYLERLRYASIFHERATLIPRPVSGPGGAEVVVSRRGKVTLVACPLDHGVPCYGYRLQEESGRRLVPELLERAGLEGPAVGELQRRGVLDHAGRTVHLEEVSVPRPGQAFALVMDTRPCPGALQLARGADLLVCEATYLDAEAAEAQAHYHMTAGQAAALARDAGARRLALTHFSQRYRSLEAFGREASAVFPDVFVAEDFTRVAVPARQESLPGS
jgi:ribonuclease Z